MIQTIRLTMDLSCRIEHMKNKTLGILSSFRTVQDLISEVIFR